MTFINFPTFQQTPKIFHINSAEILITWVINIQNFDNRRKSLCELISTDGTRREHRHHNLYFLV